ncbi:uncharacterized protein BP5553_03587 [Venustampulla echinocandica]|uniref:Uncharacterized protein n=1 Tax=Venustampulla echinocandica TaxID=2656787 RepID=A0A370TUN9_9HELO|nr:uncharacterized protein BP5553_03587 [Venustampulla echinocandica]RDL39247.1 hypothetical protein BP5553_03587 [Venustampulla echinocandica]
MSFRFVEDKIVYGEEDVPKFGELPFDHYVLENWDIASPKSESEQKADLVKAWLELGSQGRLRYHRMQEAVWSSGEVKLPEVPTGVPKNLQTPQQRAETGNESTSVMWVRTWYGDKDIERGQADAAYAKLCQHVGEDDEQFIKGNWAFENDERLADNIVAPTATGVTPSYVQELFNRYPDVLEGGGGLRGNVVEYIESGRMAGKQHFMMIIADKRACETGAVLLLAIDDFGKMMPQRLRVKAGAVHISNNNWMDGQGLNENFLEGEEGEQDYFLGDDAWTSPSFRIRPEN